MARPRNEQGGFFPQKKRSSDFKVAGHQWGWWVRQLRRDFVGFQKTKKWKNFCMLCPLNNTPNLILAEAVYQKAGYDACQEFGNTLHWS